MRRRCLPLVVAAACAAASVALAGEPLDRDPACELLAGASPSRNLGDAKRFTGPDHRALAQDLLDASDHLVDRLLGADALGRDALDRLRD